MKNAYDIFKSLVWLTQFGLSVIVPPVLCIWGSVWLKDRFSLGGWIVVLGVILGVLGAVACLRGSLKSMRDEAARSDKKPPISFNDHK